MKQVRFQVLGNPLGGRLQGDEHTQLMEALDRRLRGCHPGTSDGNVEGAVKSPFSTLFEPLACPGDLVVNAVPATFLTFQVPDDMRLPEARVIANDCLREIGRSDLRAELTEL